MQPYVKAQKNDDRDAEAIAEAATRPTMRFVALKSEAQLDLQTLHRARDRLVGERTALINQLRAFLLERGTAVPQGRRKLELFLETLLSADQVSLSPRTRLLIEDMREEWRAGPPHPGVRRGVRASGPYGRDRPAADHDPRHRAAERDGAGRRDRQGRDLRARPGSGCLAGAGDDADDHGRQE